MEKLRIFEMFAKEQPRCKVSGRFLSKKYGDLIDGMKMWLTPKGYLVIWYKNKSKLVHEYVWEKYNNMKKPKDMIIHHIDEDKSNYHISNLELLSEQTHHRIHAKWIRNHEGTFIAKPCTFCKKVKPLVDFYDRTNYGKGYNNPSARCKKCHNL